MCSVCSTHGEKMTAYWGLMGNTEGKMPLERSRRRLVDTI
jgi:hypothetical protein